MKKRCKHCGSTNLQKQRRRDKSGQIIVVTRCTCSDCNSKLRMRVPLNLTKEVLIKLHHKKEWTLERIAKKFGISVSQVKRWMKRYKVKMIPYCIDCGTRKNIVKKKQTYNQYGKCKEAVYFICNSCMYKKVSRSTKKTLKNKSKKQKNEQVENYLKYYDKHPEQKKKEIKKQKRTWRNKPEKEKKKFRKSISRGKRKSKKPQHHNGGIGRESQKFFLWLQEWLIYLNISCDKIQYAVKKDKRITYQEKRIMVKSTTCGARFLDCYIERDNREIDIEFDEPSHKRKFKEDRKREKEILKVKPDLEIYRVNQKEFQKDPLKIIFKIVSFIEKRKTRIPNNYLPKYKQKRKP